MSRDFFEGLPTPYIPVSAVLANSPPSPRYGRFMGQKSTFWAILGQNGSKKHENSKYLETGRELEFRTVYLK